MAMSTKDKERAIADRNEWIRRAMIEMFVHTDKEWNGDTPYSINEQRKRVAESEKFRNVYFNFIRRIK